MKIPTNLRLVFRNLLKNKILNGINILGLSIGIMAVLLIFQHIRFENSYDSYHEKADQIHRLVFYRYYTTGLDQSVGNNYFIGQIAYENIPEIENFFRCKKVPLFIRAGEKIFKEERSFFADSSFFDMLSHTLISGTRHNLLREPNVVVLTQSTARKYFGEEDPIGKTIYRVNPGKAPLVVQGVVKDVPLNSHLKFDMVVSLQTLTDPNYCYTCNNTNTYFLLRKGSDPLEVSSKITDLAEKHFASTNISFDFPIEYHLQSMKDIHLHSHYRFEHEINGSYKYQMALLIIAIFILLSAWLNFSNIYESLLKKRAGSIGIRKINGATWRSISWGFISETMITGLMSLILAYGLLHFIFPYLKNYLELDYTLNYLENPYAVFHSFLITAGVCVIGGLLISVRFRKIVPVQIIQSKGFSASHKRSKNLMLVVQFCIAIFLVASTLMAMKQMHYMQEEALTMKIDQTLVVKRPAGGDYNSAQQAFQERLKTYPEIADVTFSSVMPGEKNSWVKGGIAIRGSESVSDQIYQSNVAPDFFDFFGIKLLAGRQFFEDENNWTGGPRHLIVNKEAVNALGAANYEEVIGKSLYDSDDNSDLGQVVGVVDGYFQNSLDQEVIPLIFNVDQRGHFIFLRLKKGSTGEVVSKIKGEFRKYFEDSYFEYFFLDDFFNVQYKSHVQFNRCFMLFSIMAIIISSLSLLGIAIMAFSTRVKEIGIRKVNGAKVWEVMAMLNTDFMKWIVVAFAMASPLSWYAMNKWLENFAYKTELSWWIFALAGLLALGIALLTVSWQSWKAATRNPVEALRYE